MPKLRTNKRVTVLSDSTVVGGVSVYVSAVEHYEIIDPELPYEERFRTDHYTVDIGQDSEAGGKISVMASPFTLLELSQMFAAAASDAFKQLYVVKR